MIKNIYNTISKQLRSLPLFLLIILFVLVIAIAYSGFAFYANQKSTLISDRKAELSAVADIKVRQIQEWRRERLQHAETIMANPVVLRDISLTLDREGVSVVRDDVLQWFETLRSIYEYDNIFLFRSDGLVSFSLPPSAELPDPSVREQIRQSIENREVVISDIHSSTSGFIHIDIVIPVIAADGRVLGTIVLEIDPGRYLYPLVQRWPTPSPSGEVYLVRQEGESVIYLNNVRHRQKTALTLRYPLTESILPEVRAITGPDAEVRGIDYRGEEVLAAVRRVADVPWYLVAKIDMNEVLAPVKKRALTIWFLTLLLIFITVAVFVFIWQYQQKTISVKQLEHKLEREALEKHYDYLTKYANDIIILMDSKGKIIEVNERALTAYGFTREELIGMYVQDLRVPGTPEVSDILDQSVAQKQGHIFESIHRRKDGSVFPVEASSRFIQLEGQAYLQSILRDITERKAAEEELHRHQQEVKNLVENAADVITRIDSRLFVRYTNTVTETVLGRSVSEFIGKPISETGLPPDLTDKLSVAIRSVLQTGKPQLLQLDGENAAGDTHYQVSLNPEFNQRGNVESVLLVARDITDLIRSEEKLRRSNRLYTVLSQVGQAVLRRNERQLIFDDICKIAVEIGKFSMAWVGVVDERGHVIRPISVYGENNGYVKSAGIILNETDEPNVHAMIAVKRRTSFICNNIREDPLLIDRSEKAIEKGFRALASLPLSVRDDIIGVFVIYSEIEGFFDDDEVKLIEQVVADISFALANYEAEIEREKAQEALRISEQQFKSLVHSINDFVYTLDKSHRFTGIYGQWIARTGMKEKDFTGKRHRDIFGPDLALIHEEANSRVLSGETVMYEWNMSTNGERVYYQSSIAPLRNASGYIVGIVGVGRDITRQKAYEADLKKWADIFNNTKMGIVVGDPVGERIIIVNHAFADMHGYAADELIGKPLADLFTFEKRAELFHHMHTADRVGHHIFESLQRRKDGSTFPGMVDITSVLDDHGPIEYRIINVQDITERREAQAALRKTEEQLHTSIENMVDSFGIFSAVRNSAGKIIDFKIDYVNNTACEMSSLSKDELIGKTLFSLLPKKTLTQLFTEFIKVIETGESFVWESFVYPDVPGGLFYGKVYDLRSAKLGDGVISIIRDVTERHKTEEQLRLQSTALESAANAIVITDSRGIIQWINPAFTALTGYLLEEVKDKNPSLLKSGVHMSQFYAEMWKTILAGHVWQGEIVNRRKDGSVYHEEMTITPVRDQTGSITNYVAIKQDITAQKELQQQIFNMQKMESIGTLASGIAHDFNNILGIIRGYATLLGSPKREVAKIQKDIRSINQAVQRGANLVQQILTFARKTESMREAVDINRTVQELGRMMRETFPKTITVTIQTAIHLPILMIDPGQLHQALLNLCVNARDAIIDPESPGSGSGSLMVKTGLVRGSTLRARMPEAEDTNYILIAVSDTGKGIDESLKARIFDPFFTTKSKGAGTGLGLSVVYGIMRSNNGLIDVQSERGKGSTFSLYFPVQKVDTQGTMLQESNKPVIPTGTETILLVEDEEMLLDVMINILEEKGYTVLLARNGQEGLDLYLKYRKNIALVLTDLGLPGISGIELFDKIREIDPHMHVVLASGYIEPGDKSKYLAAGIDGFITKPYDPSELLLMIRELIDKKRNT
jgi:two-component system, cell cycle sensor histidine kinase and response regulator CckA